MKTIKKVIFFIFALPVMLLWLWAISLQYFEHTLAFSVHNEKRLELRRTDWPLTRFVPDLLANITAAREAGEIDYETAKVLRERAYIYRVKVQPSASVYWRQLSNFYYAYGKKDSALTAAKNIEKVMGSYYPSMKIMARHYLFLQDKASAKRIVRKMLAIHAPNDLEEIYKGLLNIMSPAEFIQDVLPYYQQSPYINQRKNWLHRYVQVLRRFSDAEQLTLPAINALIKTESPENLEYLLRENLLNLLLKQGHYDALQVILEKIGYTAYYPDTKGIGFAQSDNIFCHVKHADLPAIMIERSNAQFKVVSDNYQTLLDGEMTCVLPVRPGSADIIHMNTRFVGEVFSDKETLQASFLFDVLGQDKRIFRKYDESFDEEIAEDILLDQSTKAFLIKVDYVLKASVLNTDSVMISLDRVNLKSKLNEVDTNNYE